MKRYINILFLIVFIVTFSNFFGGCVKKEQDIKIGVILPLTGVSSNHGKDALNGIKLAKSDINKNENVKMRLIFEDDQSDTKKAVTAAQKLINIDNVMAILGPIRSNATLAVAKLAEKSRVVLISPTASSPKISNAGDFIFRTSLLADAQAREIVKFCIKKLNIKEAGVLYMNDETGFGYANSFRNYFEKSGGRIIYFESYDRKQDNFRTTLIKLKSQNIKTLYVPSIPRALGLIIKQSKEIGYDPIWLSNIGIEGNDLIKIAGKQIDNLYYTSLPISKKFIDKYYTKFNNYPKIAAPLAYDAFMILYRAIKISESNSNNLKTALYNIKDFKGVTGKTSFTQNGDANKEVVIKTVKEGNFVEIEN